MAARVSSTRTLMPATLIPSFSLDGRRWPRVARSDEGGNANLHAVALPPSPTPGSSPGVDLSLRGRGVRRRRSYPHLRLDALDLFVLHSEIGSDDALVVANLLRR